MLVVHVVLGDDGDGDDVCVGSFVVVFLNQQQQLGRHLIDKHSKLEPFPYKSSRI